MRLEHDHARKGEGVAARQLDLGTPLVEDTVGEFVHRDVTDTSKSNRRVRPHGSICRSYLISPDEAIRQSGRKEWKLVTGVLGVEVGEVISSELNHRFVIAPKELACGEDMWWYVSHSSSLERMWLEIEVIVLDVLHPGNHVWQSPLKRHVQQDLCLKGATWRVCIALVDQKWMDVWNRTSCPSWSIDDVSAERIPVNVLHLHHRVLQSASTSGDRSPGVARGREAASPDGDDSGLIEIRLLGAFDIRRCGASVELPGTHARMIVAVLSLAAGSPVTADVVAERLWPDRDPRDVRDSLYTAMRRLRHVLGNDTITSRSGGYALDRDRVWVDVAAFEAGASRVFAAGQAASLTDVLKLLELWRGAPFADGYSDSLMQLEAAILEETYLALAELRVDLELRSWDGSSRGLVSELRSLVAAHPLRESLRARLLLALVASGRAPEALVEYEDTHRMLKSELGASPSVAVERAHQLAKDASSATTRLRGGSAQG